MQTYKDKHTLVGLFTISDKVYLMNKIIVQIYILEFINLTLEQRGGDFNTFPELIKGETKQKSSY